MPDQLDEIDRTLVRLLRANGRATLAELSGEVNLSAPAVKRRIARLQQRGVILGYTAIVDHASCAPSAAPGSSTPSPTTSPVRSGSASRI